MELVSLYTEWSDEALTESINEIIDEFNDIDERLTKIEERNRSLENLLLDVLNRLKQLPSQSDTQQEGGKAISPIS